MNLTMDHYHVAEPAFASLIHRNKTIPKMMIYNYIIAPRKLAKRLAIICNKSLQLTININFINTLEWPC